MRFRHEKILAVCCWVCLLVALGPAPAAADTGTSTAQEVTVSPEGPVTSPLGPDTHPPASRPSARRVHEEESEFLTPVDPSVRPEEIRPTCPPTLLNLESGDRDVGDTRAPGTFTLFRNHALSDTETNNATGYTAEPSVGAEGRVVFMSGNFFTAISGDYGQTFLYQDPHDNFPHDGVPDPIDGGFCCDQHVYYERTHGLFFWLLQYYENGNGNRQRLAIANSQQDVLTNTWYWYDLTPGMFGFEQSDHWLDFPDLTVSNNYLYLVTKIHRISEGFPVPTNIVARIPLDQLAQGSQIAVSYLVVQLQGVSCTDGATSTMYFGAHVNTTTLRVYSWPDGSDTINWHDVGHAAYNRGHMVAIDPDGYNFADHADDWIWGAWVANGVLGFMWPATQGGGFPYPHVQVVRVSPGNFILLSQVQIWSPDLAFIYPSVHPNDRGHLGGIIAFGGGSAYPGCAAWIADDYNGGGMAPLENLVFAAGDHGPSGNRWGDYFATRRYAPYGNTWAGTGTEMIGGSGDSFAVVRSIWFGRERDTPPAQHVIYTDRLNTSGYEDGSSLHPYNTVTEGAFATSPGDALIIRVGNYPESVILNTRAQVTEEGGTVTIGQ
jgi:hypothetical protein